LGCRPEFLLDRFRGKGAGLDHERLFTQFC
jgi:hypothetical protein